MVNKITVGVFGAGRIGKFHIQNLQTNPQINVKTVFDIKLDGLEEWANELGVQLTNNEKDIFDDTDIQAVFIFSPTNTHVPLILKAAAAGKNIFCEKPISFSDEEVEHANQAVKKAGVKIQIGFNRRFDPSFRKIREAVEQKTIGDLHIVKITSRDPEPPPYSYVKVSGGIFMDMTIHDFDMMRYITGSEPETIYAQGDALVDPKLHELNDIDTAITTIKFKNGALGVIDNSRKAVYGYDQRLEAFGSEGAVFADNPAKTTYHFAGAERMEYDHSPYFFIDRYLDAYVDEYKRFAASILDDEPIACTIKDGIMAQRMAKAAQQSLETGRPVPVETFE